MNVGGMAEVGSEVALIAEELSRAVELTLNPTVSHEARNQAYNACESFKESSPWCAQAGLLLASGQYSAVVKHFGLQLMEHTVKYRWTQITQAEKIFIKDNAMKLLYMGGWEQTHLNDALARVIVEMIKREWPQQWPALLAELSDACARGHAHTQIVLHVFLRLVEDVATLQTLEQHQRRKDIYQALTSNMAEIFAFFMRLIEQHVQQFREHTAAGDAAAAASHGRVVQVVLLTLTGFVEWVSTNHVVANNGRLLQILCILLQDEAFQLPAAECLLQIVNRKGSTKERKPLMILFSEDAISCIHRAAAASISVVDEKNYVFLKKLAQVVAGLGQQLTSLWSFATGVESWLPALLDTLLRLAAHPSLALAHATAAVWLALFRHDRAARQPALAAAVPRWLQAAAPKLLKVSYPGAGPAAAYASLDHDSEEEFAVFFNRFRTELLDCFRHCMFAAPLVTWAYVEQWARAALDKVDSCPASLDVTHPLYVEWEALAQVLDVVLSQLVRCEPRPSVAEGLQLLQRCVACTPPSPLLESLLLSFVSALFVFLSCACSQLAGPGAGAAGAELLPRVLERVFAALLGPAPEPPARRPRAVKNLRRHAASLLVKLASKYPLLLLPVFGRLHEMCQAALSQPGLSALESVTIQEALLLVANHFCCYERQSALVAQVLGDASSRWAALAPHLVSAAALARLIGLDGPAAATSAAADDDARGPARRELLHALTLLLGVVKRTTVPADPDKAARGGYGAGTTASGNPLWRNPCAAHVLPLLPHALALARALHALHAPGGPPLAARALQPPAAERRSLLGLGEAEAPAAPAERLQGYVHALHDAACQLPGAAAASLGRELLGAPGLARALAGSVLALEHLPAHWLRPVARHALKPLLLHCPPAHYDDLALPLLDHYAPYMLVYLSQRWEYIASLYESGKLEEEGSNESQEMLEDMLVRHLTREHLEVLKVSLVDGGVSPETVTGVGDMEDDSPPPAGTQRAPEHVSALGAAVLGSPRAGPAVLHTVLRALTWPDSQVSLRATALAGPALRAALAAGRVGEAEASGALAAVLQALRAHGQHDANQAALLALAVQAYDTLRPVFPPVAGVLRAIPGVDASDLRRLDDKLAPGAARQHKTDKTKRDLFKKITARLIGRNVGQLFKKEVYILDLPPPPREVREVREPRGALEAGDAGLAGLFS